MRCVQRANLVVPVHSSVSSTLSPPLCFRGGCLCQMPVLTKGWEGGGQPQPFRASGGQIQRGQGRLPGGHQKGRTQYSTYLVCNKSYLLGRLQFSVFVETVLEAPRFIMTMYFTINWWIFLSAGPVRLQDHFLRTGLHASAAGSQRVRLVPQLRCHRSDVERRLHHPEVYCNFISTGVFRTDNESCGWAV